LKILSLPKKTTMLGRVWRLVYGTVSIADCITSIVGRLMIYLERIWKEVTGL